MGLLAFSSPLFYPLRPSSSKGRWWDTRRGVRWVRSGWWLGLRIVEVFSILDDPTILHYFLTFCNLYEVEKRLACISAGILPGNCVRIGSGESKLVLETVLDLFILFFFNRNFHNFIKTFQIFSYRIPEFLLNATLCDWLALHLQLFLQPTPFLWPVFISLLIQACLMCLVSLGRLFYGTDMWGRSG